MNNNPQRECSKDPNIHTYGEYVRCLNSKLSNPYVLGFEVAPPSTIAQIVMYIGIGVVVAIFLIPRHLVFCLIVHV